MASDNFHFGIDCREKRCRMTSSSPKLGNLLRCFNLGSRPPASHSVLQGWERTLARASLYDLVVSWPVLGGILQVAPHPVCKSNVFDDCKEQTKKREDFGEDFQRDEKASPRMPSLTFFFCLERKKRIILLRFIYGKYTLCASDKNRMDLIHNYMNMEFFARKISLNAHENFQIQ